MKRQCGDCQLCCKLLPVPPLGKKAGQRCRHQSFAKGCKVYHKPGMPPECALWNCRWLVNDDTAELARPDRSHYVLDLIPDYVTVREDNGKAQHIQVVQIWCDPKYPEAHRDPALRRYLLRRAEQGIAALVRFSSREAISVFAPPFSTDNEWHEVQSTAPSERTHSWSDIENALTKNQRESTA